MPRSPDPSPGTPVILNPAAGGAKDSLACGKPLQSLRPPGVAGRRADVILRSGATKDFKQILYAVPVAHALRARKRARAGGRSIAAIPAPDRSSGQAPAGIHASRGVRSGAHGPLLLASSSSTRRRGGACPRPATLA